MVNPRILPAGGNQLHSCLPLVAILRSSSLIIPSYLVSLDHRYFASFADRYALQTSHFAVIGLVTLTQLLVVQGLARIDSWTQATSWYA
jgi:hypothetical protein